MKGALRASLACITGALIADTVYLITGRPASMVVSAAFMVGFAYSIGYTVGHRDGRKSQAGRRFY